jgi:hypothetical protein
MPAVAHRAGWARPTRRNRSLRAEHVVARAHAPGGRAARPLRTRVRTRGAGPLDNLRTTRPPLCRSLHQLPRCHRSRRPGDDLP